MLHMKEKGLKMRYTTMDVENIFKSLFGIYKTTKLLMYHILCTHTRKKSNNTKTNNMHWLFVSSNYTSKRNFCENS